MNDKRGHIAYVEVSEGELSHNQPHSPSFTLLWIHKIIVLIILAIVIFIVSRIITDDQGMDSYQKFTTEANITDSRLSDIPYGNIRPPMAVEIPIRGELNCPETVLKPSAKTPMDVNQVRPADITYIAALGDSITSGLLSYDLPSEFADDERYFVGNSFSTGGDGELESHLTLPNILRHLNPYLTGFSNGKGLNPQNAGLNVAIKGRWSDDLPRQATELVARFNKYPNSSVQNNWKLINIFIGTNDIIGMCRNQNHTATSKEDYKNYLLTAIKTIQKNIPRTIISLIGMWNLGFEWQAKTIIYNTPELCMGFKSMAQQRIVEYREALSELAADASLQTDTQAVVVQRVFDDLNEPLMKPDGSYDVNFYATDLIHLSKYGNSLVAKQLWKQLLLPVGCKSTTNDEMARNSPDLGCPDEDCPFIRTIVNSQHCVIPDYGTTP